jgi:hypothetical protein
LLATIANSAETSLRNREGKLVEEIGWYSATLQAEIKLRPPEPRRWEMGTVANKEKHKLRASFYSNLATGVVITGYAVPYFAYMRKVFEGPTPESFKAMLTSLTDRDVWLLTSVGLWVLLIAWVLRRMANRSLDQIED